MKTFKFFAVLALALILVSANSFAATISVNEYRFSNGSTNDTDSGTIANYSVSMDVFAEIQVEHGEECDCDNGCTASAFGKAILNGNEIRADVEGDYSDADSDSYFLSVGSTAVNWFLYCHVNITGYCHDCNVYAESYAMMTYW